MTTELSASLLISLAALAGPLSGEPATQDRQCVIVVVGAPGTDEYGAEFKRWAGSWEEATRKGGAALIRLGPARSSEESEEPSDRDRLKEAIEKQARTSAEPLWLVLIGHGTFDGQAAKFNLRGPDVAAEELAEWLKPCDRPLAVVNCSSSSGLFINRLSGPLLDRGGRLRCDSTAQERSFRLLSSSELREDCNHPGSASRERHS